MNILLLHFYISYNRTAKQTQCSYSPETAHSPLNKSSLCFPDLPTFSLNSFCNLTRTYSPVTPQLKTQAHEASSPAPLFLEDAKANYVKGFLRGGDDFCPPSRKALSFALWGREQSQTTDRLGPAQASILPTVYINKSYMELFLKINLVSSDGMFVLCLCFDSLLCFF